MITDNALANFCKFSWNLREGGDTGKREVEHRSFLLMFTHINMKETGYSGSKY
ncbi:MAG: hypothetical protein P1Q69_09255 [Candidatus Thorarchaeota archaeon]|nr:hypothetical protein [Candidatus Thorarchaeota archaeon]